MLKDIKHVLENPNDLPPELHEVTKKYLQARLNVSYLYASGFIKHLDLSESATLGFIEGVNYACQVMDEIETRRTMLNDSED